MLYKLIVEIDSLIKRIKISRYVGLHISDAVKVNYSKIVMNKDNRLVVAKGTILNSKIIFETDKSSVEIGEKTFIGGSNILCANSISIGNDVLISWGCTIVDHNSHAIAFSKRKKDVGNWYKGKKDWSDVAVGKIIIKDKAWVGFNSIILKDVTIGEGAIIGAGSVVTKDVPSWTIVAGNPASIIREIPESER